MTKNSFIAVILLLAISFGQAQTPLPESTLPSLQIEEGGGNAPVGGGKHILLSLLLPGAGEWAMGHKSTAKYFLGAEALFWLGYFSSKAYVNVLQEDLESFAALHAGVNSGGKNSQFWIDVGTAASIYDFNAGKLVDRDLEALYEEGDDFDWQWDSDENRRAYVQRRLDRLDWKRRTTLAVGGMVLNRLASMVDVVRLIRKQKNQAMAKRKSFLSVGYLPSAPGGETFRMNFTYLIR